MSCIGRMLATDEMAQATARMSGFIPEDRQTDYVSATICVTAKIRVERMERTDEKACVRQSQAAAARVKSDKLLGRDYHLYLRILQHLS